MDGGVGRHHARRGHRLVRRVALALYQLAAIDRDGAFQATPLSVFNGRLGYRFADGWRIQLDGLNLFNARSAQAEYAYGSLLKNDNLFALCFPASGVSTVPAAVCQNGVMDYALHPMEPLAVRLTLAKTF